MQYNYQWLIIFKTPVKQIFLQILLYVDKLPSCLQFTHRLLLTLRTRAKTSSSENSIPSWHSLPLLYN